MTEPSSADMLDITAEVEAAYVCALMWTAPSIALASVVHIEAGDFYHPAAAAVFDVIAELVRAHRPAGPTMVLAELQRRGDVTSARHLTTITRYLTEATAMPQGPFIDPLRATAYGCEVTAMAYRRAFTVAAQQIAESADTLAEADLWEDMCRCGRRIRGIRDRLIRARAAAADTSPADDVDKQLAHLRALTRQNNES